MDIQVKVNLEIGVTPQLAGFIERLLSSATPTPVPAITETQTGEAHEATPTAPVEKPAEPEKPAAPVALTEVDVRAAIHRARQRIEGADYKENTGCDGYKKYHRELTGRFLAMAELLGAEKPSALPEERRAEFIAMCDELIIDVDGNITSAPAPF